MPGGSVRARKVVLAAGVKTQELVEAVGLGARIPRLVAGLGVAVVVRAPAAAVPETVVRYVDGPYLVPVGAGRVYVGATNRVTDRVSLDALDAEAREAALPLLAAAGRLVPALAGAEVLERRAGWRPTTLDTYPLVGPTSLAGLWLATGTKREGLHLSPRIAEELSPLLSRTGAGEAFGGLFVPERPLLLEGSQIPAELLEMYQQGLAEPNRAAWRLRRSD
jgi:glycine/D-amino acid oxidase-like deaminating enzyme